MCARKNKKAAKNQQVIESEATNISFSSSFFSSVFLSAHLQMFVETLFCLFFEAREGKSEMSNVIEKPSVNGSYANRKLNKRTEKKNGQCIENKQTSSSFF